MLNINTYSHGIHFNTICRQFFIDVAQLHDKRNDDVSTISLKKRPVSMRKKA